MWYGVVWYAEHYETISWSTALTVWEWLKSDMLHLTYDLFLPILNKIIITTKGLFTNDVMCRRGEGGCSPKNVIFHDKGVKGVRQKVIFHDNWESGGHTKSDFV